MSAVSDTEPLHRALGLSDDELERVRDVLGREPNHLELALYAVMWSEHCSYKSSRIHLRRLPTEGERVLVGPGENAGVIDAGDGIAVAVRIESHNHPSAIEPHQGAATGVGGILRDIFTMGARPLAVMDPLFFGPLTDARQRWLMEGVVGGIAAYGNSVGVPTVGGELTFDPCYAQNPLVNVLCIGALPVDRLVLGRASGEGNLAVLLGSTTGRDGIGGVSVLASAGFSGDADGGNAPDDDKRPSVQVGDPFEEKRLIEACLSLLDAGLVLPGSSDRPVVAGAEDQAVALSGAANPVPLGLGIRDGLAVFGAFLGEFPHHVGWRWHLRCRHQFPFLAVDGLEDFAAKVHGVEGVAHDFEPEDRRAAGDDAVGPGFPVAGRGDSAAKIPAADEESPLEAGRDIEVILVMPGLAPRSNLSPRLAVRG